ncbi:peptidoglycan hydrolase CwlO-like protein [Clostridium acetobutylicum]|uniref:hypothetical protein n=1 Tax=Clostridium TaxID=1485 RepID=UPI000200A736|nr:MULTISPECIES: hypothetical protein [Clostridium]ADZ20195.1 Conserved hypothetical protein [Clostridium acetobutylicum EA 2018]AEI31653.1 Conserved hypothetical protein [Clostridium acetobutylicum DSM 1731]MBC2393273.1 hypothetical protein [Clostridium acetobutylicum]MBC2585819.1 hypothetical protein [Clostridium acetobutylicum]NOV89965.1 peptidoglycan hydrolase CwlO-like protein [Clostridium acetobutylicum]
MENEQYNKLLSLLQGMYENIVEKLDNIDKKLDAIDEKVNEHESKFNKLKAL